MSTAAAPGWHSLGDPFHPEEERDNSELSLAGIAFSSWSLRAPGSGYFLADFDLWLQSESLDLCRPPELRVESVACKAQGCPRSRGCGCGLWSSAAV